MGKATINEKLCDKSPACSAKENCPKNAISFNYELRRYEVNTDLCDGCGYCRWACTQQAIDMIQ